LSTPSATAADPEVIDMDWRHRAACRAVDPELFFPVGTTRPALKQVTEAQTVCHRCPVSAECLRWALDTHQHTGVWGGLSEDERRQIQQPRRPIDTRTYLVAVRARSAIPTTARDMAKISLRSTGT
jgi:WhiB family redox-sensing transcriptional regulator